MAYIRSYAKGGLFAASDGLFADEPFAAGIIAGGLFSCGLNAAEVTEKHDPEGNECA